MKRVSAILVLLLVLSAAGTAHAADIKLCMRQFHSFNDNGASLGGYTEDWWIDDNWRAMRGLQALILLQDWTVVFNGKLGDGIGTGDPGTGCTSTISLSQVNRTYYIILYSTNAYVNSNWLHGYNSSGNDISFMATYPHSQGGGAFWVNTTGGGNVFLGMNTAAEGLARNNGGLTNGTFKVRVGAVTDTRYDRDTKTIELSTFRVSYKYVIAHEMGHHLFHLKAPSKYTEFSCDDSNPAPPTSCQPSEDEHSMGSTEYTQCAHQEGFGHFFSAATWNHVPGWNCVFKYWKPFDGEDDPVIDCKDYSGVSWMENNCSASPYSTFDGWGNEYDWLRVFHAVRSRTYSGTPPSFVDMMYWQETAQAWARDEAYEKLDDRATVIGGTLEANWDAVKGQFGIDH